MGMGLLSQRTQDPWPVWHWRRLLTEIVEVRHVDLWSSDHDFPRITFYPWTIASCPHSYETQPAQFAALIPGDPSLLSRLSAVEHRPVTSRVCSSTSWKLWMFWCLLPRGTVHKHPTKYTVYRSSSIRNLDVHQSRSVHLVKGKASDNSAPISTSMFTCTKFNSSWLSNLKINLLPQP